MANFGMKALLPAETLARIYFKGEKAKGLFAGMAAHGLLPFSKIASAAAGLLLMIQGHRKGWPLIGGGTQQLANALSAYFVSIGGKIQNGLRIEKLMDLSDLPGSCIGFVTETGFANCRIQFLIFLRESVKEIPVWNGCV